MEQLLLLQLGPERFYLLTLSKSFYLLEQLLQLGPERFYLMHFYYLLTILKCFYLLEQLLLLQLGPEVKS